MERLQPNCGSLDPPNENEPLDVKPLRALAPMFPTSLGQPENSTSPLFSPQLAPINAQPISQTPLQNSYSNGSMDPSFQSPPSSSICPENAEDSVLFNTPPGSGRRSKKPAKRSGYPAGTSLTDASNGGNKVKPPKKKPKKVDPALLPTLLDPKDSVEVVLMTFDALRRRMVQMDEGIDSQRTIPSLKAGNILMTNDLRVNKDKRLGSVPGVEVGDIFYFRMEMLLVGLHSQSMAGIDCMTTRFDDNNETVAISIVSAGGYENEVSDNDSLIYTGQGGNTSVDQKLVRGNLALQRSLYRKNLIRVIRSTKDFSVINGKIYYYDGLYKVEKSWDEKAKSGIKVFKYKLARMPGQPFGLATWKMTQQWKDNPLMRGRMIIPDISSGVENIPVCLVNEVDDERGPGHFMYVNKVDYKRPLSSMKSLQTCKCLTVCLPGDNSCLCAKLNGENLPYSSTGSLVKRKRLIFECNASCSCSPTCRNRVSQKGIRLQFEVFKTRDRGWGLRCWDPIRAGTFICEYVGEVIDKINLDDGNSEEDYIFQTTGADHNALKWNYGPELLEEQSTDNSSETIGPLPIILSAKSMGNLSRFMNHSCSPNVFWQPVLHDHGDEGYPHIMFFAMRHIPPLMELTYDYGLSDGRGSSRTKKCLCGSPKCRGHFG